MRRYSLCNVLTLSATSLNVAEVDLAAACNRIQQFKEISLASEEALASLNMTHNEYKSTTEAQPTASYVLYAGSIHVSIHEYSLFVQYEALQNTLKSVEQELTQNENFSCGDQT